MRANTLILIKEMNDTLSLPNSLLININKYKQN